MSESDLELLKRYTRVRAEDAFTELVRRHVDLVHTAALRQVHSRQLAEEVAQSTFVKLARLAPQLASDTILTAWLYQVTRREAIDVVRREARRQLREQIATEMNTMNATTADWTHIEPLLDEAMHALDDTDRAAVLLRYFEKKSLREVGASLGTSDDAAQKRVSRAVERLREFFAKRGITVGASGLVVVITANAVQAAPAGLATTIATAAALSGTALTATATKAIAMTTLQKTLIAVTIVAASVATPLVIEHQARVALRDENESLRQQLNQLAKLSAENERLSNLVAQANSARTLSGDQHNELLRLRGEVGRLRAVTQDSVQPKTPGANEPIESAAKDLLGKVDELKQRLDQMPDKKIPEIQFLTPTDWINFALNANLTNDRSSEQSLSRVRSGAKDRFAPMLAQALRSYTESNGGQLPIALSQLKPYFDSPVDDVILERYQLLHTGNLSEVPSEDMLVREKAPVDEQMDTLYSIALNRYSVKPVTGNGIRGGGSGETVQYIPGLRSPK